MDDDDEEDEKKLDKKEDDEESVDDESIEAGKGREDEEERGERLGRRPSPVRREGVDTEGAGTKDRA